MIIDEEELFNLRYPGRGFIIASDGKRIPLDLIINTYCKEVGRRQQLLKTIIFDFPHVEGKLIRNYTDVEVEVEKLVISGLLVESIKHPKIISGH